MDVKCLWEFDVQAPHKCGVFAPHHPIFGHNKMCEVVVLPEAEVQLLIIRNLIMHRQNLFQFGPDLLFLI